MSTRLGIVGTESTHAAELIGYVAGRPDVTLAATLPGEGDPVAGVEAVGDIAALVDRVDAVAIFTRDARRHAELALPVLGAGLRVFVDKPLAAGTADAEAILQAAAAGGGAVTSFSALRFLPVVAQWRAEVELARAAGRLAEVGASGKAEPASPYAGAWFYGVHTVELLAGFWADEVRVEAYGDRLLGQSSRAGIGCRLEWVDQPDAPFALWWTGTDGTRHEPEVVTGPGYFDGAAAEILAFLTGGDPAVDTDGCRETVRVTETLVDAWRKAGRG